jgi:hypothetical protein
LIPRRRAVALEPEPFDYVEAVDDIRFGETLRFLPRGTRLPIDHETVLAAPELFVVPARRLVRKEVK